MDFRAQNLFKLTKYLIVYCIGNYYLILKIFL